MCEYHLFLFLLSVVLHLSMYMILLLILPLFQFQDSVTYLPPFSFLPCFLFPPTQL